MKQRISVSELFLPMNSTIQDAISCIDRSGKVSIALLVDENQRLVNTISDGDVRRGILAGQQLTDPVTELLAIKAKMPNPVPVTALFNTDPETLLAMMRDRGVRQIPLVDEQAKVVDVVILNDLLPLAERSFQAVVMAGGLGTRLRPLTDSLPKPMLPVGGRPLMELIIEQLREVGVQEVSVTTHYHPEKIKEHFGDGKNFGVRINYVNEENPLGTGGALGLLDIPKETLLVINGDILTQLDYRTMFQFHHEQHADMTMGVRRYEMPVPYGVVECDGCKVQGIQEKPVYEYLVNAGIYLLEPSVFRFIPNGEHMHMTDLIGKLLAAGRSVVSYPICEYWLDIGQPEDYQQAQRDAQCGRLT